MRYIETQRQCADIYTKAFTDRFKWLGGCVLINHYPNYTNELLQNGARIDLSEYKIMDHNKYVVDRNNIHGFYDDELYPFSYADREVSENTTKELSKYTKKKTSKRKKQKSKTTNQSSNKSDNDSHDSNHDV